MGPARYEQLLDLVLTLRKPQLAKDLNPVELSRTLQRGLRPIEDTLLVEAARSFDDMEAVARTLEGLVAADGATAAFLGVYATYLRTHARAAADALSARRADADERARGLRTARAAVTAADAAADAAQERLRAAEGEPGRLRAHLDALKSSVAYRSHEQLADLERHAEDLSAALGRAESVVTQEDGTAARRRSDWERELVVARDARAQVGRLAAELAGDAEAGGIDWTTDDAAADGLGTRVSARAAARRDDVTAVRMHADRLGQAEAEHVRAAETARAASAAVEDATAAEVAAEQAVHAAREQIVDGVRRWAADRAGLLTQLGLPELPDALAATVDGPPLREVYADAVAVPVATRRDAIATLTARSHGAGGGPLRAGRRARQHRGGTRRCAAVGTDPSGRPDGPARCPALAAGAVHRRGRRRRRGRDRSRPARGRAARCLAAPGRRRHARRAGRRRTGRLPAAGSAGRRREPRRRAGAGGHRIWSQRTGSRRSWRPSPSTSLPVSHRRGRWGQGVGVGRFAKDRCEYIGATARAARRAARIAECDRRIAELDAASRRRRPLNGPRCTP